MFFHSLLSSLWYFSFYHLLFFREVSDKKVIKTLKRLVPSISIYIFIAFHFLMCDLTSYMQF